MELQHIQNISGQNFLLSCVTSTKGAGPRADAASISQRAAERTSILPKAHKHMTHLSFVNCHKVPVRTARTLAFEIRKNLRR